MTIPRAVFELRASASVSYKAARSSEKLVDASSSADRCSSIRNGGLLAHSMVQGNGITNRRRRASTRKVNGLPRRAAEPSHASVLVMAELWRPPPGVKQSAAGLLTPPGVYTCT